MRVQLTPGQIAAVCYAAARELEAVKGNSHAATLPSYTDLSQQQRVAFANAASKAIEAGNASPLAWELSALIAHGTDVMEHWWPLISATFEVLSPDAKPVSKASPLMHKRAPGDHYALCERSPALMRENGEELVDADEAVTCPACTGLLTATAPKADVFAPDAVGMVYHDDGRARVHAGDRTFLPHEARDLGFVPALDKDGTATRYVQADQVVVTARFGRGGAQRFKRIDLAATVERWLREHAVTVVAVRADLGVSESSKPWWSQGEIEDFERDWAKTAVAGPAIMRPPAGLPGISDMVHYVSKDTGRCRPAIVTATNPHAVDGPSIEVAAFIPPGQLEPSGVQFHEHGVCEDTGTYTGGERVAKAGQPLPVITCDDLTFKPGSWHRP